MSSHLDKTRLALVGYLGSGLLIATLGRLLPHPANVTPLTAVAMMTAIELPWFISAPFLLSTLLVSDLLLASIHHYHAFGSWTLFTWSGYLLVMLAIKGYHRLPHSWPKTAWLGGVLMVSLLYWLWTNFGCWLLSGLYPHNSTGLLTCYIAAIPFLRHSLLGNLFWSGTILLMWRNQQIIRRLCERQQHKASNKLW